MTRGNSNPKRRRTAIRKVARKSGKWGGAVVTVLLLVVWIGSGWVNVACAWPVRSDPSGAYTAGVLVGRFYCERYTGLTRHRQTSFELSIPYTYPFELQLGLTANPTVFEGVQFPLWCPVVIAFGVTSLIWRADLRAMRRAKEGLCAKCGYDLSGTAAGAVCPECGRAKQS